ncbi:MAG: nucleoside phosphorylase [Acidimicrobiales bacterium]|jgi:uridine phosphorylase
MEQLPLTEDDLDEPGVIEAYMLHDTQHEIAPVAVLCFFNELLEQLAGEGVITPVYTLRSEIGFNPVYEFTSEHGTVAVVHPGVGAPLAAGITEEMAAIGVTTFVACGGAGALVDALALGQVMVVASAVRDEGTSFHYAAPSRIIEADTLGVRVLSRTMRELDRPFFVGRTWTTDGFMRETRSRVQRRIDEGCAMVDMESSAFIAVARYRHVRFAQLLYAGDSLAGESWDYRHWDSAREVREGLFYASARAALNLHQA